VATPADGPQTLRFASRLARAFPFRLPGLAALADGSPFAAPPVNRWTILGSAPWRMIQRF